MNDGGFKSSLEKSKITYKHVGEPENRGKIFRLEGRGGWMIRRLEGWKLEGTVQLYYD